jgi:geranylgeranyl transferase type-2 subunit alpha
MFKADERNFHCWNYRTWVVDTFKEFRGAEEEMAFTDTMILRDFSNFSAWHYRTKVVEEIHGAAQELPEAFLASEFELLQNAYFTCPYD